jgi:signal transduction histidine kinase
MCIVPILLLIHFITWSQVSPDSQIIKVGVYNNPPKIFINEKNVPDGVFIDIIKSIAKSESLKIKYFSGNWNELYTMLERNEIDILPDMAYSKERDSLFYFSIPVLNSWLQVFTTKNCKINKIDDLQNKRIGVLKSSSQEEYLKADAKMEYHIDYSVFSYDSYYNSVEALKNNEIDVIVANRFFYFSDFCDNEIVTTGIILQFSNLHFAFSKKTNPNLIKLFDKGITQLTNNPDSDYYASIQKWFNKKRVLMPLYIKGIIIFLVFGLLVLFLFAYMLKSKVKDKTKILSSMNKELIQAKEIAEENDRLKSTFLKIISHELRTPMNGIIGFSDILTQESLDSEKRITYTKILHKSIRRLMEVVDNVMIIAHIQTHQIVLNPIDFLLSELLLQIKNESKDKLKEQEKESIEFRLSGDFENVYINCDYTRLQSCFSNLIDNAIKFTKKGEIEISYSTNEHEIIFQIRDTGSGFSEDKKQLAFQTFTQSEEQVRFDYGGLGIGLSICSGLVKLMQGRIELETQQNKGTQISIFLNKRILNYRIQ